MGTTNYGNQVISIQYLDPVDSSVVNRMLQDILPVGIYKGGKITKSTDTQVVVSPLVVSISDGTYRATIRTTADVSLNVSPSTPYVVLRWSQPTESGHYMDFFALAKGDIQDNDLIVGKCVYSGSTLIGISYEERSYPVTAYLFCKVVPDDSLSMRVKVLDGWVSVSGEFKRVPLQYTSTVTAPSSKDRIDLVYIDPATGVVGIEAGTEADDPVPPSHNGKIPLAHLHLSPGMTEITEKEIVDVRSILAPTGVVYDTGNQTINGVKTFTSIPVLPSSNPSNSNHAVRKAYVDHLAKNLPTQDTANKVNNLNADKLDGKDASDFVQTTGNQTINGVKTFTAFPVTPSADPGSAYEVANKQYVDKKDPFRSGDLMLSTNDTPPPGWSDVSATYDNRFIRISSGTPLETGGSDTHNHGGSTEGHALTIDEMPAHSHSYLKFRYGGGGTTGSDYPHDSSWEQTSSVGGGQPHSHGIATAENVPAYVQVRMFRKN